MPGLLEFVLVENNFPEIYGIDLYPEFCDIDGDEKIDLLVGNHNGNIWHYIQSDTGSMNFVFETENFSGIDVGSYTPSSLETTDFNGNGLIDILVGREYGNLMWYEQDSEYSFSKILKNKVYLSRSINYLKTESMYKSKLPYTFYSGLVLYPHNLQ